MRRGLAQLARVLSSCGSSALVEQTTSASVLSSRLKSPAVRDLFSRTQAAPAIHASWDSWRLGANSFSTTSPPPSPSSATIPVSAIEINSLQDFQSLLSLSQQCPVVLDCWASWCGPCKQLDPVLKGVVDATEGAVKLAKLNIENPALAPLVQQMQVSSVPTMFLLFGGRMLDMKVGVPPQQELKAWVAEAVALAEQQLGRTLGGQRQQGEQAQQDPKSMLERGFKALDSGAVVASDIAPLFAAVLPEGSGADAGDKARALAGLAMCAMLEAPPNLDTARELVANAKEAAPAITPDEVSRADSLVQLAVEIGEGGEDPPTLQQLQDVVEADPMDLPSRYTLALCQFAAGQHAEAIDSALAIVRADRDWRQQAGKQLLLRFFDAMGSGSELSKRGRKRLSNIWFM